MTQIKTGNIKYFGQTIHIIDEERRTCLVQELFLIHWTYFRMSSDNLKNCCNNWHQGHSFLFCINLKKRSLWFINSLSCAHLVHSSGVSRLLLHHSNIVSFERQKVQEEVMLLLLHNVKNAFCLNLSSTCVHSGSKTFEKYKPQYHSVKSHH